MQNSRFLVLTGHLNDYPLSDLVGILRHQQKTGRLLIEYPNSPASFFFNDGELVDARLDNLSGLQAVCVALAQPPSSFNFNPLIRPTRRSIENSLQKVVSELLGCWSGNELEVENIASGEPSPQPALLAPSSATLADMPQTNMDRPPTFLSLPPGPTNAISRPILAMGAAGLFLLGLSTVIAVTGVFGKRVLSAATPSPSHQASGDSTMRGSVEGVSSNLPKATNHARGHRTVAKGKDAAEQSTRPESGNSSVIKKVKSPEESGVTASNPRSDVKAYETQAQGPITESHSIKVALHIEGGRVAQASIANHRSGMEAYEALALRIARQRRYPAKGATQEMVTIKVNPPK